MRGEYLQHHPDPRHRSSMGKFDEIPQVGGAERLRSQEFNPEEHFGDLLTAGNDERKLILLAAMEPDRSYSMYGLYRLALSTHKGFSGFNKHHKTIAWTYAGESLAKKGLVELVDSEERQLADFRKTPKGTALADPYAGHMLKLSEDLPLGLHDYLGTSASPPAEIQMIISGSGEVSEHQRTGPLDRFLIYEKLLELCGDEAKKVRSTDIADAVGLPVAIVGAHLNNMGRTGIINYESIDQDEPIATFTFNPDQYDAPYTPYRDYTTLSEEIFTLFKAAADEGVEEITCQSVAQRYLDDHPEKEGNVQNLVGKVNEIANHMERSGFLTSESFRNGRYSDVSISAGQRGDIAKLVATVNQIRSGDETFYEHGKSYAQEILDDPQRVSSLIGKAQESSPHNGRVTEEVLQGRILGIISEETGYITNADISTRLREIYGSGPGVAKISLYLRTMRNEGIIPESGYVRGSIYHYRGGQNIDEGVYPYGSNRSANIEPEIIEERAKKAAERELEKRVREAIRYQPEPADIFTDLEIKRAQLGIDIVYADEERSDPEAPLTKEQVNNILHAIGNNEQKAILLAGMEAGKIYSRYDLHMLVQVLTGKLEAEKASGAEMQYAEKSLEPMGLVTKHAYIDNDGQVRVGYTKTALGEHAGTALASALLVMSARDEFFSMHDYFGSAGAAGLRYQIYEQLASDDPPKTRAALAHAVGADASVVGNHLRALQESGIITYNARGINAGYASFRVKADVPDELPQTYRGKEVTLTPKVLAMAKTCVGAITSESIHAMIIAEDPDNANLQKKEVRSRVSRILSHLSKEGFLEYTEYSAAQQSKIEINEEQREGITNLVSVVQGVQNGDLQIYDRVQEYSQRILEDPEKTAALKQKAIERSPFTGRVPTDTTKGHILEILEAATDDMKLRDIHAALREGFGSNLNLRRVIALMAELKHDNVIDAEKVGSGFVYRTRTTKEESEVIPGEPEVGGASRKSIAASETESAEQIVYRRGKDKTK